MIIKNKVMRDKILKIMLKDPTKVRTIQDVMIAVIEVLAHEIDILADEIEKLKAKNGD